MTFAATTSSGAKPQCGKAKATTACSPVACSCRREAAAGTCSGKVRRVNAAFGKTPKRRWMKSMTDLRSKAPLTPTTTLSATTSLRWSSARSVGSIRAKVSGVPHASTAKGWVPKYWRWRRRRAFSTMSSSASRQALMRAARSVAKVSGRN